MPILNDILDHDLLGPAILQGRLEGHLEGRREGRQEGRLEGRQEVQQDMVRRILGKRLGVIPEWVETRLRKLSPTELDEIADRALDTESFENLFPSV